MICYLPACRQWLVHFVTKNPLAALQPTAAHSMINCSKLCVPDGQSELACFVSSVTACSRASGESQFRKLYLSDHHLRGLPNFRRFTKRRLTRHVYSVEAGVRVDGVPPVPHRHNFCVVNDVHAVLGNVVRVSSALLLSQIEMDELICWSRL